VSSDGDPVFEPVKEGPAASDPYSPEGTTSEGSEGTAPEELLAAFERRSPVGGLRWGFDDALRRIGEAGGPGSVTPWEGLPDDLWERGRSAQIGQRLVGDVAGVMAEILATDARTSSRKMLGDGFVATWDAFRYLAARVAQLEERVDPLGLEAGEWPIPVPDPSEWGDALVDWVRGVGPELDGPVVLGEIGDGSLVRALLPSGRAVVAIDPRGDAVWPLLGESDQPDQNGLRVLLSEVETELRTMPDHSTAVTVLVGCIDRVDLSAKARLLAEAIRVTRRQGRVVLLTEDQGAWEDGLDVLARDLAPGRPFHPDTWSFLLDRSGAGPSRWYRPVQGSVHAVVATVNR
jgi:hypothetical protein